MSQLRIVHETVYTYARPVELKDHRLVLRPRESHDVRLLQMRLSISPPHQIWWREDIFGNSVATVRFEHTSSELRIVNDVILDRTGRTAALTAIPDEPSPVKFDVFEDALARAYLLPSFPEQIQAVSSWLDALGLRKGRSALAALRSLCATLHEDFAYRNRTEKGVQAPADTLARRSGSCRDKATLMLEASRCLAIPARFVSGYLDCAASHAGSASTHAWVEVYLPHTGWVGLDPTIGEVCSAKHIPVGVSAHPRGVMPVSGHFSGPRSAFLGLTVAVSMTEQD